MPEMPERHASARGGEGENRMAVFLHCTLRRLIVPALLLIPLLLAAPAARAQLDQIPGQAPNDKEAVQLYRQGEDKTFGSVSIPDYKLSILVQPEGRDWREFRNVTLRIVATVLMVGFLALLAIFYFWRGTVRIEHGRSGTTVTRFNGLERFAHWTTAVSFLVLALTGLIVLFGRLVLIPVIGHEAFSWLASTGKLAHNFLSVPFVIGILLMFVLWIRDNIPEKADITWFKQGGGMRAKGPHPEAGRFNAGQKLVFWMVVLGGVTMAISGYMLMFPFYVTGIGGMQFFHIVHAVLAALLITMIIGHIYIGTLGMEGAFDAMATGQVDENWAKEHHSRWYETVRRGGKAAPRPKTPEAPQYGHRAGAE
jgi:formate dehydrogenase subunit gamma